MHNFFGKLVRTGLVCGILMTAVPMTSMAAIGPGFKTGTYIATITAESVNINKTKDGEDVLTTAKAGSVFEVLEDLGNGWMKIRVNDTEGYLPVSGNAEVEEAEAGEIEQVQKEAIESSNSYKRQQLVSFMPFSLQVVRTVTAAVTHIQEQTVPDLPAMCISMVQVFL